ncbi:MAG: heparinase II/III family protein [Deltaproteobacteria bacterium]|nr:heparinase II/III family protein [Deltaproteobacteria bacterium]
MVACWSQKACSSDSRAVEEDPDRDGVSTARELESGTDPQDPSSAPQWQPQWSEHPRLLFDAEQWSRIKAAILDGEPGFAPYYDRLEADGERPFEPHSTPEFQPQTNERNSRTVLGAAVTLAVKEERSALDHLLQVLGQMRTDVSSLSTDDLDKATIHTSKALINLCEAYDLLEGMGMLSSDARTRFRESIRSLAAEQRAFYEQGLGQAVLLLTQNNHNIKVASGLAIVGMTLNELPEAAAYVNYGLMDAWYFLTQYQCPPGGGQAEGPAYLAYSALNYLPAFWAYHRFARGESFPYKVDCTHRSGDCHQEILEFADPITTPVMRQIHRWWHRIAMPDGYGANIEDSNLNCFFSGTVAAMFDDPVMAWRDSALPDCNGHAGGIEMLRLATAHSIPEPRRPQHTQADFLVEAGQAVFRSSWSQDAIWGLLIAEHDIARVRGFGHEQPDASSFIVAAFGEYLLIDSGYISFTERSRVANAENHNLVLVDGQGPPTSPIGLGADADAWLDDTFSREDLAGASATTGWVGCEVIRDVVFSRKSLFMVADRVLCPAGSHDFCLLWHTHAGGTTSGELVMEADGFSVIRDRARIDACVGAAGDEPRLTHFEAEHAMHHSSPETHEVFQACTAGGSAAFLSAILPVAASGISPAARVVHSAPDAVAVVVEDGEAIEWFGVTRGRGPMAFASDGTLRSIATDARSAFVRLSVDGRTVKDFQLTGGTYLEYDGRSVK